MTPSIHLVRLKVSGWKGIKEAAEIEFGDASWLIHGANEAGKSSLFSALRFALFEYSAKGGAFSDNWVNNDSTQAEVEVELFISGAPFTIKKIRDHKKNGKTTLFDGHGASRRERGPKNKDADNEILQLIGASARKGRELETPSSWGILAWLLAPQAIDTVIDARDHATEALGLGRAISPEFQQVKASIAEFARSNFGTTGNALKGSELREATEAVDALRDEQVEIERQRGEFDNALLELAGLQARLPDLDERLKVAQAAHEGARGEDVDFATGEEALKTLQARIDVHRARSKQAEDSVRAMVELDQEVDALQEEMTESSRVIGKLGAEERAKAAALDDTRDKLAELSKQLDADTEQITRIQGWIQSAQHLDAIEELDRQLDEVRSVNEAIAAIEAGGPVLTHAVVDERIQLAADLEQAESLLVSLADERGVKVSVQGQLDATWRRDGVSAEYADGLGFASRLEIETPEFTVVIRQDEQKGAVDWVQRRLDLREELQALGVQTTSKLREEMAAQRKRSQEHKELCDKRDRLANAATLAAEKARLAAIEVEPVPEGTQPVADLNTEIQVRLDANKANGQKRDKLQSEEKTLVGKLAAQGHKLETARAEHKSATDRLAAVHKRRDKEIEQEGQKDARETARDEANKALQALEAELLEATDLLDLNKGVRGTELKRLLRVVRLAEKDLSDAKIDIKSFERQANALGGQDLQSRLIAVGDKLAEARERYERVERRSEAYKRLNARIGTFVVQTTGIETAPVRDRVQRWLRLVTQGHWTQIEMESDLEVTRLSGRPPAIDGEAMGSAGLRQVIHALTRLAVAVKIHEDASASDPNYPPVSIVMDESQSHVDSKRVQTLMHVFNEQIAAGTVQIVALSHRRDEFQNLQAMNYDIERREAYDLDAD